MFKRDAEVRQDDFKPYFKLKEFLLCKVKMNMWQKLFLTFALFGGHPLSYWIHLILNNKHPKTFCIHPKTQMCTPLAWCWCHLFMTIYTYIEDKGVHIFVYCTHIWVFHIESVDHIEYFRGLNINLFGTFRLRKKVRGLFGAFWPLILPLCG